MEEGTILQWLKSPGEDVELGEELVEIETDKASMVYEADTAGTVIEIVAAEGETVPIGAVIALVGAPGQASSGNASLATFEAHATSKPPDNPRASGAVSAPQVQAPDGSQSMGASRIKASPLARRMARARGLDLATLTGSGPGGRIVKADIEEAASGSAPTASTVTPSAPRGGVGVEPGASRVLSPKDRGLPPASAPASAGSTPGPVERPETAKGRVSVEELTKLQQTVARRMAESKATAPHFYLRAEVDMSRCVEARAALRSAAEEGEPVPSFNDMVVKAAAIALREHPRANGAYRDGRLELYERVNVGVAVAAQDALVVPTVFDADRKGLRQIARETRALAERVRDGTVTPPELSGGTFTVSNLGMFGIDAFSAVINPPQAAILAVGAIVERPVARGGEIATAHLMTLDLACDHRILYGADGARFLDRIRGLLAEPLGLAL